MRPHTDVTRSTALQRIIQFPLTRIVLAVVFVLSAYSVAHLMVRGVSTVFSLPYASPWVLFLVLVEVLGALLGYYAYVRLIEHRAVTEVALQHAPGELGVGLLIGVGLFSITIGIIAVLGSYTVRGTNGWRVIPVALATAISAGVVEELLFRAILFRITEEALGTWLALGLTAILFGVLHLITPLATVVGAVAIILEAGILLAAAYMVTRRIWLALGIHTAWNFAQGGIFGVNVSGNEAQGLLQGQLRGPILVSGGVFGAEASLIAVLVCLIVGMMFIVRARQQRQIVQPMWQRKQTNPPHTRSVG